MSAVKVILVTKCEDYEKSLRKLDLETCEYRETKEIFNNIHAKFIE